MGRLLLIYRLVLGDIKRRGVQSVLLVVMIVTTTTTLTLGLMLHHVSQNQFARTRAATRGPDVAAEVGPAPGSNRPAAKQLASLLHARGVAATSGPFPVAFVALTAAHRISVPVQAEGRRLAPSAVDQPLVTSGHWVRTGQAVIEQGLADSLGLRLGDTIRLGGHAFEVGGIAVTTEQGFYPGTIPGLVWLTHANAQQLATPAAPLGYILDIKLTDPPAAPAFAATPAVNAFAIATPNEPSIIEPWQGIRTDDYKLISLNQKVLLVGSLLLSMLAIASIAVLVGGRMAEQTRRVGLLKAVGGTPSLIAAVLLAENLLLALAAAIVGLVCGDLLAPLLSTPGQGLLGSAVAPHLTVSTAALVVAIAAAVAAAATIGPTIHGARTSTIRALTNPVHQPQRRPWLIAISAALPVPLLLGLRLVARRPRRAVLTATSLTIAVAMVVTALTVQHDLATTEQRHAQTVGLFISAAVSSASHANHLLITLSVILVILAATSATVAAWTTVIDSQASTALARALGASPRQISAGLTTAQLLPGLAAACVGIPAGLLLYQLAGGHLTEAGPPLLWLLGVIPGTLVAVAAMTAVPARIGAHRSVAEVLRSE